MYTELWEVDDSGFPPNTCHAQPLPRFEPDHAYIAIVIEHLALVIALRGDRARATKLEGYADAACARHGYPREFTETTTHDRLTALLREERAPDELARLSGEGAALTPEAAVALELEEDEST